MLWVGENEVLRIGVERRPNQPYPDDGSSVEIYTNPDPAAYVELETLNSLVTLFAGQSTSASNHYSLSRR